MNGSVKLSTRAWSATIHAAAIWPGELDDGRQVEDVVECADEAMISAPHSTAFHSSRNGSQLSIATSTPAQMASPPSRGVGVSASPRSRGSSIAPHAPAPRRVTA